MIARLLALLALILGATATHAAERIVSAIERGEDPEIALAATGVERQRHEAQANGLRSARGDSGTIARWLT